MKLRLAATALLLVVSTVAGPSATAGASDRPRTKPEVQPGQTAPTSRSNAPRIYSGTYPWPPYSVEAWPITGLDPSDGDPSFHYPGATAVGPDGDVYVTDGLNGAVLKFDPDGNFLLQWGTQGTGDGQFDLPAGIATDSAGDVYVADYLNNRIQVFSPTGVYLRQFGTEGRNSGEFSRPSGIAIGPSDNVFVADTFNDRIQKFDPDGTYLTQWGTKGTGGGEFDHPVGVAVGDAGRVYVVDNGNRRVESFAANGAFITDWGAYGTWWWSDFDGPMGVATDRWGNVYVSDTNNDRIQQFDPDGNFLNEWGWHGADPGQFDKPGGLSTDVSGNVYVADVYNKRVQVFGSCCGFWLDVPWQSAPGTIQVRGWMYSTAAACVDTSDISLLADGQVVGTTTTGAQGEFVFDYDFTDTVTLSASFAGKPLPGGGSCAPATSFGYRVHVGKGGLDAQSGLRNALAAAKTCFTDRDSYTGCGPAKLQNIEPALDFIGGSKRSSGPWVISSKIVGPQVWAAAARSSNGTCYYIKDNANRGTTYGHGSRCTGTQAALKATHRSW